MGLEKSYKKLRPIYKHCYITHFLREFNEQADETVCYYHVTYAFQSESTRNSCLNVKELFARNRR